MNFTRTDTGIYVPYYFSRRPKRPTAFDFFAGAGGFSCGLIQAGFEVVGANEFDAYAALTYMVNLGSYPINIHFIGEKDEEKLDKAIRSCWGIGKNSEPEQIFVSGSGWIKNNPEYPPVRNFWFGDVAKLKGQDILEVLELKPGDIDVVVGGPPCQGFSKSGRQRVDDQRNQLVYEFARLIVELQPKTFVMEEVPDVINFMDPDGVPVIDKFCMMLEEGGYGRWEMIKKSLEMQSNSAVAIKSRIKMTTTKRMVRKKKKKEQPAANQVTLDDLFGVGT